MPGLTRYKNSHYFNQYAILQYVRIDNTYITSQIVYPISGKCIRFKNHDQVNIHLSAIIDAVEDYIDNLEDTKYLPKFVIYIDKESYNAHSIFTNDRYTDYIDFRIYNEIVPGYTTCIPDISIKSFNVQFETAIKEIIYYVNHIGLGDYIDKIASKNDDGTYSYQTVSFAYSSRRFLEKDKEFKNIVKMMAYTNINRNRYPNYKFVKEITPNVKQFNANKLVCHGSDIRWKKACKYDIDSSFWAITTTEYTGKDPHKVEVDEYGLTKKGDTLLGIIKNPDNMYFAKIRIGKLVIAKENKWDWLHLFNIDLSSKSMFVSNVEVQDILDTYEIDIEDIIIDELYLLTRTPFTNAQRDFYKHLHARKATAKQNGETLLKMCLKIIGHSLHGYALGNWFTEENNEKAYFNIANINTKGKKRYANHLLTPIDSMYFYSYARSHLLKILDLFGDNFYFDTDSVVSEPNDNALKKYNEWINSKYSALGLDVKDYTHDGHTMGYLELEEECETFCHLSPKFYLWVNNGNLHSTTAGYAKNTIAQKIEEVSGLKGKDALEWFLDKEYMELDLGYISDGKKYISNVYKYKKVS